MRTLESAVSLSKEKLLNPENISLYQNISRNSPVLIVLAAGKGTRFGTDHKCIQPVCGIPLARHTIDAFRRASPSPVICLVGYRYEDVCSALGNDIIHVRSDNPAGGTGFAAWEAFSVEELEREDPLLIITMGDRVVPTSIFERIMHTHGTGDKEAGLTFLTARFEYPRNHGRGRVLRDGNGTVERIMEQGDIEKEEDPVVRTSLENLTECNCPLYAVRAGNLRQALSKITNENAQEQYYLTDIISILKSMGEILRTVTVTPEEPEYDLLSSDVTRAEDLALLEGVMSTTAGVAALEESRTRQAASRITQGRSRGQVHSIARQLETLYGYLKDTAAGFSPDLPLAIGISGGRLRIAFMHPDMERFFGPAWQMPIGADDERGEEQIIVLVQEAKDHQLHIYPMNPHYREKIDSIPSDNELFYPSANINDLHTYEQFGTRMSENLLLSLGYFSDDELNERRKKFLPLPPASLWVNCNMRRPFTLVANAIASIRTLRHGNIGAKVQKFFGRDVFCGLRVATAGDIPQGGFSSSSAVTVAAKNAINSLYKLEIPADLLIHLASQAEYGTGVRAGSLDQATEQKGVLGEGTLISSNPRDNYKILGTYPVPTDRYAILFPYSVERDREAWKWSWGFYGSGNEGEAPTAGEIRKMTGKAAAIGAIIADLPPDTDFFKVIEKDLLEDGELSIPSRRWITEVLRKLPLSCEKEELHTMALEHITRAGGSLRNKSIEGLFTDWKTPLLPSPVCAGAEPAGDRSRGAVTYSKGVPLRAIVAYLFAEVVRNFYMIHHQEDWIRCVTLSQRGDCCIVIDPDILPPREQMEQELEWERGTSGPARLEAWLTRCSAVPFDHSSGIRNEDLNPDYPVDFMEATGGNFFRGLALIDLAEGMLKRAFGKDAAAVRVNAAGQGDYFQVHIDRSLADPEEVKEFIRTAFYERFGLAPVRQFVEPRPGAGAAGIALDRADMLPLVVQHLRRQQ